jgi:lipopolysaccharide transport system ATP-binding protein
MVAAVSSDKAIVVENLSKIYRLGVEKQSDDNLATAMASFFRNPLANYRRYRSLYNFKDIDLHTSEGVAASADREDILWALQDISFEVPKGQILGIVGRNGAGKSTLLKILSRITAPTGGIAKIYGRVGSLLEVGTGFHQELTGRENIYLNGTILGLRKREVDRIFDEIVDFAGVERFLDTPVKRYSSGMKVRLGFAVAAHLEPEVLIVDEVLAVGDAEFKRKCLGKMESIGEDGRTILFVSHNMPQVTRLCNRVIMLEDGRISRDGGPHEVVEAYLSAGKHRVAHREWPDLEEAPGGNIARLRSVSIRNEADEIADTLDIRRPITVQIEFDCLKSGHVLMPAFSICNEEAQIIFCSNDLEPRWVGQERQPGRYVARVEIPGNLLTEGTMIVNTAIWEWEPTRRLEYHMPDAVAFQVVDTLEGDSARGHFQGDIAGVVRPKLDWQTERVGAADPKKPLGVVASTG